MRSLILCLLFIPFSILLAHFSEFGIPQTSGTYSSDPQNGGTIIKNEEILRTMDEPPSACNLTLSFTATPNSGYYFSHWTNNDERIIENPYVAFTGGWSEAISIIYEDIDGDGVLDLTEDLDGDGNFDIINEDVDGDGQLSDSILSELGIDPLWFSLDMNNSLPVAEDLNGNGILDPGEDLDGNGMLSESMPEWPYYEYVSLNGNLLFPEDLDGDGRLDLGIEDLDGDGIFDNINEDIDGDGHLDVDEDLDNDNYFDTDLDPNGNGILDIGEDPDGDGRLDFVDEDIDGDRNFDVAEDIDGDGKLDTGEDINFNRLLDPANLPHEHYTYDLTAHFIPFYQQTKEVVGNSPGDYLGFSTSISSDGTRLAIGSIYADINDSNNGSVKVLEKTQGDWVQLGETISFSNEDKGGWSISISSDGEYLAVGAPYSDLDYIDQGYVRIFKINAENNWVQVGQDLIGDYRYSRFGWSVSLSSDGSTLAVGSPYNKNAPNKNYGNGSVTVYNLSDNNWTQAYRIDADEADEQIGYSVSISEDGNLLALSSPTSDINGQNVGKVQIYQKENNNWSKLGGDFLGDSDDDEFGRSVCLADNGNLLAIGAPYSDESLNDAGKSVVYQLNGSSWNQLGNTVYGLSEGDKSGRCVNISESGQRLAIGAEWNDENGTDAGQVRVFELQDNVWLQISHNINGEAEGDWSGRSISISNDCSTLAISSHKYGDSDLGKVIIYEADSDLDGLSNFVETNTGIYINNEDTGTSPITSDSDSDGMSDLAEISLMGINFNPNQDSDAAISQIMEMLTDARITSKTIQMDNNRALVDLDIEKSNDLNNWVIEERVTIDIPIDSSKNSEFFRFKISE